MKITDLLKKNGISLNPNVKTKEEAINKLVDLMNDTGRLNDKEAYKEAVLARESLSTTGIGDNIAIPHAKTTAVKEAVSKDEAEALKKELEAAGASVEIK